VDRQKILMKRGEESWQMKEVPIWPKVKKPSRRKQSSHTLLRPGLAVVEPEFLRTSIKPK
jgi:hypothetical protein